ncbi:hypothetical protein H0H81_008880 [Sphagnurus paluster]|uniref:Uncharacterized protein n=1 Tax=Sphagnurus paluster TaxID=117069 RepID=A0A9P7GJX4_9AGAR|nr:hypothetical protein H0H81_008880 [Sphagnurus paluster]
MDTKEIDEDSIRLDALQAQIDMSMSFATAMVSTWLKPSHKLTSRSKRDIEAELQEHMRRPPRLGVGAVIPEGHNASRETSRLKGQLVGKGNKCFRDDEPGVKQKSDDEAESRTGAIKKKARLDPFGEHNGKKKKKRKVVITQEIDTSTPMKTSVFPETELEEQEEVISMVMQDAGPSTPTKSPKGDKQKKDLVVESPSQYSPSILQRTTSEDSAIPLYLVINQQLAILSLTPHTESSAIDVSSAVSLNIGRQAQPAVLLKQPLLNLAPPRSDDGSGDDANAVATDDSPKKKKRRRRKKKKNSTIPESCTEGATDGS